eukprot:g11084.t1
MLILPFMFTNTVIAPGLRVPNWLVWIQYVSPVYWGSKTIVWWAWKGFVMEDLAAEEKELKDASGTEYPCEPASAVPQTDKSDWFNGGRPFLRLDGDRFLRSNFGIDPENPFWEFWFPFIMCFVMILVFNTGAFLAFSFRYKYQCSCGALCCSARRGGRGREAKRSSGKRKKGGRGSTGGRVSSGSSSEGEAGVDVYETGRTSDYKLRLEDDDGEDLGQNEEEALMMKTGREQL